jgi:hypothetical protein
MNNHYIFGRCKSSKRNTKIIQVNDHENVKIRKRLESIINKKIIEFPKDTENEDDDISQIGVIIENMKKENNTQYTNFALSFRGESSNFVVDKLYLYNSFSYYDFFGIESLFDINNLL